MPSAGRTYSRVAFRAFENTGEMTASNLDELLSKHDARLDLELVELPLRNEAGRVLGDQHDQRQALAGTFVQARFARGVTEVVDNWEVNHKTEGRLGEVRREKASWSEP